MTHDKKINYMRIASGIMGFDNKSLDTLVSLYELVISKEGSTDLSSMSKV